MDGPEMSVYRILRVKSGHMLGSFRGFLSALWPRAGLDAILAPVRQMGTPLYSPQQISTSADLDAVNPFAPCMSGNTAALVPEILQKRPGLRLAALLRPCELRTLTELQKRRWANRERNLLTIGVDCLGTYPAELYIRLAAEHSTDRLSQMSFSGPPPPLDRMRSACQICDCPEPWDADIMVGTIGVARRQYILIGARDEATFSALGLQEITDSAASEEQIAYRSTAVTRLSENRKAFDLSRSTANGATEGSELSSLLACVSRCSLCADCLDNCPLYRGELAGLLGVGSARDGERPLLSALVSVSRWLASCTRCGVCEDACERGVPLMAVISNISRRIQANLHYTVGDPAQKLPWVI
jgi:formate dehydrogenase subunit beta